MNDNQLEQSFSMSVLITKYLRGTLTEKESRKLAGWIREKEDNLNLFRSLTNAGSLEMEMAELEKADIETSWINVQRKMGSIQRLNTKTISWKRWAIAAVFAGVIATAGWQFFLKAGDSLPSGNSLTENYSDDIGPGKDGAILTLGDGTRLVLDSINNGVIGAERGARVVLKKGQLEYERLDQSQDNSQSITYNTIHIPRGRQFQIILPDGTKVWLNSSSSLKYPVAFTGTERRVEITGEAYFEVTKDAGMPFRVQSGDMDICVLGTDFNVTAYPDEDIIKAALINGKIQIRKQTVARILLPGQQAESPMGTDSLKVDDNADLEQITAWKNGLFVFNNTPLPVVMRQLSRWYDVDIEYDDAMDKSNLFTGEMSRQVPISKLLQMMQLTGIASFRVSQKKVTVLPYISGSGQN